MSAREKLINFMHNEAKKPLTFDELCTEFGIEGREERQHFHDLIDQLIAEGSIYQNSSGKYGIPDKFNLICGRIERSPKGFGFLIPDDPTREDIYISMENMDGAMHNDKVFIKLLSESKGKRQEGQVTKIVERANKTIVGNMDKDNNFGFVVPDNKRIFTDVFIPKTDMNGAKNGQKVVAEIETWPEKNRKPEG